MHYAFWLLRGALAFALLYAAISALITPDNWSGWFPQFIFDIVPIHAALLVHSILEIMLAIWILSGWKIWIPSIIFTVAMMGIVLFNIPQMDIVFRDISLGLVGIALALVSYHQKKAG